ncbi:MAG: antibiotic biosynthesis monooxygenase [Muribaculaceae bacterium]|nr:antibiotic biosynthesis monooxygenase [Muribaculaceae bacterium]
MIRLNCFFEVKDPAMTEAAIALGNELVKCSLKDKGCVAYGLFRVTLNPTRLMFCETWQDETSLTAHAQAPHFVELVPKLEALTVAGLKLEKFLF